MIATKDALHRLHRVSLAQSLGMILFDWAVIVGLAAFTFYYFSWPLYLISLVLIGNRQHGLLVLMHDSSHFRLTSKRWLNDFIGEFLLAWPLFIRMRAYREKHNLHHKYSNSELDPDFRAERYLKCRKQIFKKTIADFLLINTHEQFYEIKRLKVQTSAQYKMFRALFYVVVFSLLTFFGAWKVFLMYWILPAFTWLKVVLRLRAIADHTGVQHKKAPFDTRTIVPTLVDRLVFAPHHCSYHLVHHMYGAIPCQNLKKAHQILSNDPDFVKNAHLTKGFYGFFMEFPWEEADPSLSTDSSTGINLVDNMPPTTASSV